MKFLVIFSLAFVAAMAAPQGNVYLLQRSEVHDDVGQFALRYSTSDGTTVGEQGALKPTNDGKSLVLVKEGDFSWISPEGITFKTVYVADQYGYRAQGAHLPKSA